LEAFPAGGPSSSLSLHKRIDGPWPADQPQWDKAFLDQLSVVKSKFGAIKEVKETIYILLKGPDPDQLSRFTKEDLERGQKFGFATFRWKMK
jgi:hypothetical protein